MPAQGGHKFGMTWKTVRLELAGTPDFPNGSAARAYLLRLPLNDDGSVDEARLADHPGYATVRRHWPNQPDKSGYLLRKPAGWAFSFAVPAGDDAPQLRIADPIRPGTTALIAEADGITLPFRIVECGA